MDAPVEFRYAGVVVASATEILRAPGNDSGMFLVTADPLPVGTVIQLADGSHGRVEKVVESPDPRGAGMYIRLLSEDEAAAPWVPQLPEMVPLPAPRRVPTPPGVPLVSPRVAEARPTLGENGERRPTILGPVPPPVAPERSPTIVLATPERQPTIVASPPPPATPPPPPVEPAGARDRRNTLVGVAVVPGAKVSGEFVSRSPTPTPDPRVAVPGTSTIVIADEDDEGPRDENMVQAPMDDSTSGPVVDDPATLDQLQPARPLPPPDGRRKTARKRRNTR
jgi:hypothetical protein